MSGTEVHRSCARPSPKVQRVRRQPPPKAAHGSLVADRSEVPVTVRTRVFFPAIRPGFPVFVARSSKVQYNGRKRRSCGPVSS